MGDEEGMGDPEEGMGDPEEGMGDPDAGAGKKPKVKKPIRKGPHGKGGKGGKGLRPNPAGLHKKRGKGGVSLKGGHGTKKKPSFEIPGLGNSTSKNKTAPREVMTPA
jgi:hypothetical protein